MHLLKPGGRIVNDDLTPILALPADSPFRQADLKREFFAGEPRLVWTEVVLPDLANSLLVGTRTAWRRVPRRRAAADTDVT